MIAIDLSKQKTLDADLKVIKQINFTRNLDGNTTFFIIEEVKETILDFSKETVSVLYIYSASL